MKRFNAVSFTIVGAGLVLNAVFLFTKPTSAAPKASPVFVTNSGPTEVVPVDITANGRPAVTLAPNTFVNLPTHLGIQLSQMLQFGCAAWPSASPTYTPCYEELPDGTQSLTAFVIPAGYELILTDANWTAQGGKPGETALFGIAGGSAISPTAGYHESLARVNDDGLASENVTFAGGLRFTKMPIFALRPTPLLLFVRGYIVPSP